MKKKYFTPTILNIPLKQEYLMKTSVMTETNEQFGKENSFDSDENSSSYWIFLGKKRDIWEDFKD